MSKLLLSSINDWDAGTLTYTSQHPSFPAAYTQQRWYKKPWRSEYPADHTTDQYLYMDLGSVKTFNFIGVKNHNLRTGTGSVTVYYYSDAFITVVTSEVLTWHAAQMALRTARTYQYIALKVTDPANPDGYLEIGRVWVGLELLLHYGFNPEHEYSPQDPSIISASDDGQESSVQRSRFAEYNLVFDAMTPADRISLTTLFEAIGKSMPCFIVEAPTGTDFGLTAKYVRFTDWKEVHIAGAYWGLEVSLKTER